MSHNSPETMAPAEIISEISSIHSELKGKLDRIHVLSQNLYRRVRRGKPTENTAIYLQYANAWIRFSGMANQGSLRTAHASKVLRRLAPETQEAPVEKKKAKPKEEPKEPSPVEALMSLYSNEELEGLDVQVLVPEEDDSPETDEESDYDPSDEENAFDSDEEEDG